MKMLVRISQKNRIDERASRTYKYFTNVPNVSPQINGGWNPMRRDTHGVKHVAFPSQRTGVTCHVDVTEADKEPAWSQQTVP